MEKLFYQEDESWQRLYLEKFRVFQIKKSLSENCEFTWIIFSNILEISILNFRKI